ncbi:malonate decarboxylase delta subunit [Pseudoduganella flava]|uniref:Malonate decarboxylase acyl carrier protein n=1 Tax=Pseudoduganella flava TaxID=871742 RepID=A0A562PKJ5_9BURK|nr:malonate decarboxylase subunit delta [Pseudoduganella flava]QGZ42341.1 malonate decarboxylase subunit delta [Pseudoduganella flava]TWI44898.1 malonate decarboxylase delta subunit [Pseudoduganella flava]
MEKLQFEFAAGQTAASRVVAGVVASGDLEVLLEPAAPGRTTIAVQTSVDGYGATWKALLERVFAAGALPAAAIEINDNGATPGVVRMRIEQAFEDAAQGGQP